MATVVCGSDRAFVRRRGPDNDQASSLAFQNLLASTSAPGKVVPASVNRALEYIEHVPFESAQGTWLDVVARDFLLQRTGLFGPSRLLFALQRFRLLSEVLPTRLDTAPGRLSSPGFPTGCSGFATSPFMSSRPNYSALADHPSAPQQERRFGRLASTRQVVVSLQRDLAGIFEDTSTSSANSQTEGNMLANKLLILAACSMGIIEPVIAEDQPAGAQYSPAARRLSNGQYRAEIWRQDDKGQDVFVGTNYKPHASAAKAMNDACLLLRKYFDPSFACSEIPADQESAEKTTESSVSVPDPKPVTANRMEGERPVAATTKTGTDSAGGSAEARKVASAPKAAQAKPGAAATMASNFRPSQWGKHFWDNQARWGHGGGDGGGGGGSE